MVICKYKIVYDNGITQFKNLISHWHYLNVVKPIEWDIYELERANKGRPTKASKEIKKLLKDNFGEYFTTESSLFYAIDSGVIELLHSKHKVKITELNN